MNELLFALELLDSIADYLDLSARNRADDDPAKPKLFKAAHDVSTVSVLVEGYADYLEGVLEGDTEPESAA